MMMTTTTLTVWNCFRVVGHYRRAPQKMLLQPVKTEDRCLAWFQYTLRSNTWYWCREATRNNRHEQPIATTVLYPLGTGTLITTRTRCISFLCPWPMTAKAYMRPTRFYFWSHTTRDWNWPLFKRKVLIEILSLFSSNSSNNRKIDITTGSSEITAQVKPQNLMVAYDYNNKCG